MKVKKRFTIEPYEADVWLVVAWSKEPLGSKLEKIFGTPEERQKDKFAAFCSYGNGEFGVYFEPDQVNIRTIAHEVFHLTHRILEWASTNFDKKHHEHAACLHGYLMELVMKNVKLCH